MTSLDGKNISRECLMGAGVCNVVPCSHFIYQHHEHLLDETIYRMSLLRTSFLALREEGIIFSSHLKAFKIYF